MISWKFQFCVVEAFKRNKKEMSRCICLKTSGTNPYELVSVLCIEETNHLITA